MFIKKVFYAYLLNANALLYWKTKFQKLFRIIPNTDNLFIHQEVNFKAGKKLKVHLSLVPLTITPVTPNSSSFIKTQKWENSFQNNYDNEGNLSTEKKSLFVVVLLSFYHVLGSPFLNKLKLNLAKSLY